MSIKVNFLGFLKMSFFDMGQKNSGISPEIRNQ
jgi:hypothetical protein